MTDDQRCNGISIAISSGNGNRNAIASLITCHRVVIVEDCKDQAIMSLFANYHVL
jgi:hypothetical protein